MGLESSLTILKVITAILGLLCVILVIVKFSKRKSAVSSGVLVLCCIALALSAGLTFYALRASGSEEEAPVFNPGILDLIGQENTPAAEETEPTAAETAAPTEPPVIFAPAMSDSSNPENFGITWEIFEGETALETYSRPEPISFGEGDDYFALPGIATFRGNNYRNNATYGTASVSSGTLTKVWSHGIGKLDDWGGCAWTGQPLLVQWDEETKSIMNLYEKKKAKEDLVEVIYATLDGRIHFYDLADGSETRDAIKIGMNFKGAGALDPRGYPLLYVGSGLYTHNKEPRMYVISLITGEILYQHGNLDPVMLRNWSAFDSSPLVDAETDTLIWPGESGVLYTIKLNTVYDKAAGTISVSPDAPVKTRYSSSYSESGRY